MEFHRSTAAALVAIGLLAGCASQSQPSLVPSSGTNPGASQLQSAAKIAPDGHSGRVLYVADIDGQPGLGQIHVYPASMNNPQQIRLITNGAGRPFGMFVDSKNNLFVANQTDKLPASVTEFKPGASSPFFTISNFKGMPQSVAVDATGNVYVHESVGHEGFIEVFPPGKTSAAKSIDTGVGGYAFDAGSVAFDPKGNLIIAEQARLVLHVLSLAPGASTVTPLNLDLKNISGPGLGIDKAGNLYIASNAGTISVFAPGQTEPFRTISQAGGYGLTAVTPEGAVYQSNGESTVEEIAPGAGSPTNLLTCTCSAQGVAVSH